MGHINADDDYNNIVDAAVITIALVFFIIQVIL